MKNATSNIALSVVLAFATALSTAACATDADTTDIADGVWLDAKESVSTTGARSTELMGLGGSAGDPVVVEGSACECATAACVEQYVRDHIGCDLCVDFSCADGSMVGGCVRCAP